MKKSTSKPAAKSPAPATKAAPAAKSPAVVTKAPAAAPKPAPAPKAAKPAAKKKAVVPVAAPAPSPVAAPAPVPAVKPVATKPVVTTVTAQIDIGFGNSLFIRGEGAGLSWDKGLLMNCVSDSEWQVVLGESSRPIVFKFLVNDLSWSAGQDYTVAAGTTLTLVPTF
ncbi:MAG: hypothetical protein NTV51_01715 [Verrucomicrobia bacterium]|nr:hypothetical protein [Verrucomicrobiota bacterium]